MPVRSILAMALTLVACTSTPSGDARVDPPEETAVPDSPARDRIPNYTFTTHEGQKVRLYDDLVRGKYVIINFMYTNCDGI